MQILNKNRAFSDIKCTKEKLAKINDLRFEVTRQVDSRHDYRNFESMKK